MEPLAEIVAIVAAEVGPDRLPALLTTALGNAAEAEDGSAEERLGEWLWDALVVEKPEAFVGATRCASGVALAYRYARRRLPETVGPLELTPLERRVLRQTRTTVAHWSGLRTWRHFRHVAYQSTCTPVVATVSLRRRCSGGFALTWHKGLRSTAIYPQQRIDEYRELGLGSLVGVLLHEEAHLATAAYSHESAKDSAVATAVFEAAAVVVGHVAALIVAGYAPTRAELLDYLEECDEDEAASLVGLFGARATVPAIVGASSRLAVGAGLGERHLRQAAQKVIARRQPMRTLEALSHRAVARAPAAAAHTDAASPGAAACRAARAGACA